MRGSSILIPSLPRFSLPQGWLSMAANNRTPHPPRPALEPLVFVFTTMQVVCLRFDASGFLAAIRSEWSATPLGLLQRETRASWLSQWQKSHPMGCFWFSDRQPPVLGKFYICVINKQKKQTSYPRSRRKFWFSTNLGMFCGNLAFLPK